MKDIYIVRVILRDANEHDSIAVVGQEGADRVAEVMWDWWEARYGKGNVIVDVQPEDAEPDE